MRDMQDRLATDPAWPRPTAERTRHTWPTARPWLDGNVPEIAGISAGGCPTGSSACTSSSRTPWRPVRGSTPSATRPCPARPVVGRWPCSQEPTAPRPGGIIRLWMSESGRSTAAPTRSDCSSPISTPIGPAHRCRASDGDRPARVTGSTRPGVLAPDALARTLAMTREYAQQCREYAVHNDPVRRHLGQSRDASQLRRVRGGSARGLWRPGRRSPK
jgi:hypothetical protein